MNQTPGEGPRLFHDTFRHLTTLSTGSILLLATFVKDLFPVPEWSFLVGVSFGFLIVSIVSSVFMMALIAYYFGGGERPSKGGITVILIGLIGVAGGFILGIVAMVAFALKNFY